MRNLLLILTALVCCLQAASAESVNYYLKRVAIHARLLESSLDDNPTGGVLEAVTKNLLEDLQVWESGLGPRGGREDVRDGLHRYRDSLSRARVANLDAEQKAGLSLLLAELEQAAQSIQSDSPKETIGVGQDLGSVRGSSWSRWGGFAGPWGPGCDPWGPYFGRPLNPGACPWYW